MVKDIEDIMSIQIGICGVFVDVDVVVVVVVMLLLMLLMLF